MTTQIAYLASPYTHADLIVMELRFQLAVYATFELHRAGQLVYSPIVHNTPINNCGIHGDHKTWFTFDQEMLSRCDKIIVLQIDGWEESKGVSAELETANKIKMPIEYFALNNNIIESVKRTLSLKTTSTL